MPTQTLETLDPETDANNQMNKDERGRFPDLGRQQDSRSLIQAALINGWRRRYAISSFRDISGGERSQSKKRQRSRKAKQAELDNRMDSVIDDWRVGVQAESPTYAELFDISIDPHMGSLAVAKASPEKVVSKNDIGRSLLPAPDFAKTSFRTRAEESGLNAQNKVESREVESAGHFPGFSGVHIAAETDIRLSLAASSDHGALRPSSARRSSTTLADEMAQSEPYLPDMPALPSSPSSLTLRDSSLESLGSVVNHRQGQDLDQERFREYPEEHNESRRSRAIGMRVRQELPRLSIPQHCYRNPDLLNGTPFDLLSTDSASTRSSLRIPELEAKTISPKPSEKLFFTSTLSSSPMEIADVPIPVFPYAHLTTRCKERDCPIWIQHEKGPYIHEGKLRVREGTIFGASNPPPRIWEAYDRIKTGTAVPKKDVALVNNFVRYHFGFSDQGDLDEVDELVNKKKETGRAPRVGSFGGVFHRLTIFRRK